MASIIGIIATFCTIPVIILEHDITATVFMLIMTIIAIKEDFGNENDNSN